MSGNRALHKPLLWFRFSEIFERLLVPGSFYYSPHFHFKGLLDNSASINIRVLYNCLFPALPTSHSVSAFHFGHHWIKALHDHNSERASNDNQYQTASRTIAGLANLQIRRVPFRYYPGADSSRSKVSSNDRSAGNGYRGVPSCNVADPHPPVMGFRGKLWRLLCVCKFLTSLSASIQDPCLGFCASEVR